MNLRHPHLLACLLLGCTGQSGEGAATAQAPTGDPSTPSNEVESPAEAPGIALVRGLGHERKITEVWLDARASSALTLDEDGGVRLWPALPPTQTDLAALAPIRVPVREPLWLSHARAGANEFVVAAIDTAQAARVLEIEVNDKDQASFRTRFSTIPSDPLLEVHVLDGGDRVLALGVDHRIRLYDGHGKLLSELVEYGLAPWQLRIAGPPEALQLAMVLAGPTRLQRFTITDDRLAKHGEARAFVLDRGPNHNDLSLLPSGRVAAVLRRPDAKGVQWSIELHDLDTGSIRVLWGEVEAKWRPRLHIVDDERALLEDGIAGYWVDLRQGVSMPAGAGMPAPFELPEKLEELPPESHVSVRKVPLTATFQQWRMHASVVAGVRSVPVDRKLVLDPLDRDRHHRLGHPGVAVHDLDFDSTGELLAIDYLDQIVVESLTAGTEQTSCPSATEGIAFIDPNHLMLISKDQAQICEWRAGKILATSRLTPEEETLSNHAIHPTGPGEGKVGVAWEQWDDEADELTLKFAHASYANNQFGPVEPIAKSDLAQWSDLEGSVAFDAAGNRYSISTGTRKLSIKLASGERREIQIVDAGDGKVDIREIEPSPDGRFVAIVTRPEVEYGYGYYGYGDGDTDPETLSVWAIASDPPELRWSTTLSGELDLAWTDDGSRLAMQDDRLRVITNAGEVLVDRASRDFRLEELPDEP